MNRVVRIGNVLLLSVLALNLGFPLNWYSTALGDSTSAGAPPVGVPEAVDQRQSSTGTLVEPNSDGLWPADWPFGKTFIQQTLIATHGTLFGPVPAGQETVFYPTDEQITGTGSYTGVNNQGEPFDLEVIRFHQYASSEYAAGLTLEQLTDVASSGQRTGLFWGTMSTGEGHVNVVGISMSWLYGPGGVAGGGPEFPLRGVVPIMNHDVLMDYYYEGDPANPSDVFPFEILAEDQPNTKGDCPDPMKCITCPPGSGGTLWCPCKDPAFHSAQKVLDNCLSDALTQLTDTIAAAVSAAAVLIVNCLALSPPGIPTAICLALVAAALLVAVVWRYVAYGRAAAICYRNYNQAIQAAFGQACHGG